MNECKLENPAGGWWVIANPAAGRGAVARRWLEIRPWLADVLDDPVVQCTEGPGQGTAMAARAVAQGCRRLLAVGGDGTCHELLNGIFRQQTVPTKDITLSVLPIGTGNDWARTHRIPPGQAAWKHMMRTGRRRPHDAGRITFFDEQRVARHCFFLNAAGLAFDAHVVQQIDHASRGRLPGYYFLLLLRHLLRYQAVEVQLQLDRCQRRDRFFTIEAGIGRYIGGGLQLMPHADPTDGRLAVTLVAEASKLDILFNLWRFFDGSIGRHRRVALHQVKRLAARPIGDRPLPIEADGEWLGWGPAQLEIIPAAFQIWAP